ncbi:MAG: endopeptidase La [Atribacterota bacterium]|jgi:ATP-dependent Lon protease|nr:endopeptidase La [Atribacterota bacterium]MDI9596016.1 endopeptidase La [Atribacterota bacterium]
MNTNNIKDKLAIIAMPGHVLFKGIKSTIRISRSLSDTIYPRIKQDDDYAIVLLLKDGCNLENYQESDLYNIGSLVKIEKIVDSKTTSDMNLEALERVEVKNISKEQDYYVGKYDISPDIEDLDKNSQNQMLEYIKNLSAEISKGFVGSESYIKYINSINDLEKMISYLMQFINISPSEKQELFEIRSRRKKCLMFLDFLIKQKENIKFQMEINAKLTGEVNKQYREKMLREQLKAIQEELNEGKQSGTKKKDYLTLINESKMPEDVKEIALEENEKLENQGPNNVEANVIRNYLDLLIALPWGKSCIKEVDIKEAKNILEKDHYGLDKVKERIIQHLTVMKLKNNQQGSILLLVGPPGTGKTSLGKSIAKVLQREYVRISLGGVRDEAEIRGHRRTYVGALPGRIIQGIKKARTNNPVFILDEVDKLLASNMGDPASALLEVLDPEQNNSFSDHYLEVPYDLSDVFFIGTANSLRDIPEPLRDRMEIIQIHSYTTTEKFHIAKRHLMDEVLENHGLTPEQLKIEDDTIKAIIDKYTREAGVRGLKKQLSAIARHATEKIIVDEVKIPYIVKEEMLFDILGPEISRYDKVKKSNPPGVVTGLAWTPVGGDILFIESAFMPGKGELTLTGQLGDVMKESAKISQSLIRSRLFLSLEDNHFDKHDLHIHIPQGSIPKDGPSAGVTLFTSIASLFTGIPVDAKIAMTGEISLRGTILPVGGIKEKVIAAHRSGIKKILLPLENKKDLCDVPEEIKKDIQFIFIETIEELMQETLGIKLPRVNEFHFYIPDKSVIKKDKEFVKV